jgi:chromate reductase, NAD(P)H dehydrogenase (quinone)
MTLSKKILAFGASSSIQSINKKLAQWAANQIPDAEVTVLDLNDFEMSIYSIDKQNDSGIPELAINFKEHIAHADGIIISFAEHNGSYSSAFKNIYDWISRIDKSVWMNKPMFLLATSPGKRGGKTVLEIASANYQRSNSSTIMSFSLPSFKQNFSENNGITNEELLEECKNKLNTFIEAISA